MKEKEIKELADLLEKSVYGQSTYEDAVTDGTAMERLSRNPDFVRYRRIFAEAYAALIARNLLVGTDALPAMQGAMIQHRSLMSLPEKVTEAARRLVDARRQEQEEV